MDERAQETIFATATPPGIGGVGVMRISGPAVRVCAEQVLGRVPPPRHAHFSRFIDETGATIDSGIALFFPGPNSLTGEDVLELQGHGSPVVQQMLAARLSGLGVRSARPGEFLERAYLNDKIDLAQAEAIADLIESETAAAARAAQRSLEGVFSERVKALQERLTRLRVFIEAALDFPDEEIDFIADSDVLDQLHDLANANRRLLDEAHQGQLLRDGITIAIFGQPNAGKSSLLNALSGRDSAIVTDVPGTTRDVLRETLSLEGVPVHVADTAGIREAADAIEAEGVRRARHAVTRSDLALLVIDSQQPKAPQRALLQEVPEGIAVIEVVNKIDLEDQAPTGKQVPNRVWISATTGAGVDELIGMILQAAGATAQHAGNFSARARHIESLKRVATHLRDGQAQLTEFSAAETLAEELRQAQKALGEITGEFLPDDLLGAIFASFCIGK